MQLNTIIDSIITEKSGLVVASFSNNFLDAYYIQQDELQKKRSCGDFGSQWLDKNLDRKTTRHILSKAGLDFDESDYAVFEDNTGDCIIIIKDHRVLLHGINK